MSVRVGGTGILPRPEKGLNVRVLERAKEFGEVGAGTILAPVACFTLFTGLSGLAHRPRTSSLAVTGHP